MRFFLANGSFLLPGTRKVVRVSPTRVIARDLAHACAGMARNLTEIHGKWVSPDFVRMNVRLTVVADSETMHADLAEAAE